MSLNACVRVFVRPCIHLQASLSLEDKKKRSLRCTRKQKDTFKRLADLKDVIKSPFIPSPRSASPLSLLSLFSLPLPPSFFCAFFFLSPSQPSSLVILMEEEEAWSFPRLCGWHNAFSYDGDQANCAAVISVFHRHQQKKKRINIKSARCSKILCRYERKRIS